jgi:ABC-type sulfate/molybdate transport systems ATPase subunit
VLEADVEVDRRDFRVAASLLVPPGERLALFGPSGAGKTTLLETIAGLIRPRAGRILLAGRLLTSTSPPVTAVPPWRRRVGLLRQHPAIFPHLSVRDNLRYAAARQPESAATEMAATLGVAHLLDAMPAALSGGEKHRVALGRALLARCDALLLDEPFSGLDVPLRRALTEAVLGFLARRQLPAILVSHELADAQAFASRLAVLDDGRVLQAGPPEEIVSRPASRRVAELAGYLSFVPAGQQAGADGAGFRRQLVAGIHPERVLPGAHPGRGLVLNGTVLASRPAGAGWEAKLAVPGGRVIGRLPERPGPPGTALRVTVLDPPLFGPDGRAVSEPAPAAAVGEPA